MAPGALSRVGARYLAAALFLLTGGLVFWYNATHGSRVIVLPLLTEILPSLRGKPDALGDATAAVFAGVGVVLGLVRVAMDLWRRRRG
jgi:hypothetical protein